MWSVCSSLHVALVPRWKLGTYLSLSCCFLYNDAASIRPNFLPLNSLSKDEFPSSASSQNQLGFDPSEELFGLDVDLPPRDQKPEASEPRSWFGPNGQYIKELPCPNCRGRGYTPCTECGIERFRQDCSLCGGKGIMTCQRCLGERVIWEESIDEKPWEKARSVSPLKVKEDDEVDNLDLNLDVKKKSKRVYRSPPPEVGLKISRSLKSLNAKTGLFSKRMKIIHRDPALHAQRVAAIKKAKRTAAARKHASETVKTFFSDPENRRQRSIAMKGVKFFCKNCGREGHRKYYCPELGENADRRFRCRLCGQRGHNKRTCQKSTTRKPKHTMQRYHCRACGQVGHNRRTCIVNMKVQSGGNLTRKKGYVGYFRKPYECRICGQAGHNSRTCPQQSQGLLDIDVTELESSLKSSKRVHRSYKCRVCGTNGHNRRTCSERTAFGLSDDATARSGSAIDPGDNQSLSAH